MMQAQQQASGQQAVPFMCCPHVTLALHVLGGEVPGEGAQIQDAPAAESGAQPAAAEGGDAPPAVPSGELVQAAAGAGAEGGADAAQQAPSPPLADDTQPGGAERPVTPQAPAQPAAAAHLAAAAAAARAAAVPASSVGQVVATLRDLIQAQQTQQVGRLRNSLGTVWARRKQSWQRLCTPVHTLSLSHTHTHTHASVARLLARGGRSGCIGQCICTSAHISN